MSSTPDVPVRVIDRVVLPHSEAPRWVGRMRAEYQPIAESRGFTCTGVWHTRAAAPHAVEVVVEWWLPDVRAFWRARAGGADPAVTRWWAGTDAVALARTRSVLGPVP